MNTQIQPRFKEEPGFNALKISEKQIHTPDISISFSDIKGRPNTLLGYGITDAINSQAFRDFSDANANDMQQLRNKLNEMEQKIAELERRIAVLENK